MIYRVERKENPFVQVDKGFINDKRLGFKEKGILLYFLSKPDGWNFYEEEIASNSTDGLSAVKAGIHKLMENGYIVRGKRVRNAKGQLGPYEYVVKEVSATCENPTQGFPTQDNPTLENHALVNTDDSNIYINNIESKGSLAQPGEQKSAQTNEIDNDNDNDRIVDVSYNESYHESLSEENKVEDKSSRSRTSPIPYEKVSSLYSTICTSYPKLAKLSDARKKAIHARFNSGYELDDFKRLFEMAEGSSFLKGKNDRHWSATFDWLIKDTNMAKVLEGNYADDKSKLSAGSNVSGSHTGNKKGWGGYLC